MSDAHAIEAVTATMCGLVQAGMKRVGENGVFVRSRTPTDAENAGETRHVNVFLYQTDVDSALRNEDPLDRKPGEVGDPALPLVLHYLVTPYLRDGDEIDAHRVLGGAIQVLHEHTLLTRAELEASAPFSDVAQQLDRIRITWQPVGEKDIYSLWSAFQTPYRLSAAFEVRAVLIDSTRPSRAAVPVLKRGAADRGPVAAGDVASPFPELTTAVPIAVDSDGGEHEQFAAPLGGRVLLRGTNLANAVRVRLTHPLIDDPVERDLAAGQVTDREVRFDLTPPDSDYAAGMWSVAVVLSEQLDGQEVLTVTNDVPLPIAPTITTGVPTTVAVDAGGTATIPLTCEPPVRPGQPALLLLGSHAVALAPDAALDPLTFEVAHAPLGEHLTRLRVGGVDSLLVDRTRTPPEFDTATTVTVTP